VDESTGIARYRTFLAVPHTRSLFGWALLARMPLGMAPLALLLLLRAQGASYAAAGAVVAAYGLALAGGALVSGRLIDRRGPVRVLTSRALAYPACFSVVVALALADAPIFTIGVAAAAAGALIPPVSSSVRSIWPQMLPTELRSTAYSLEAAFQEIIFVIGPLLAGALSAIEPSLAVAVTGAATLVGTLGLVRLEPVRKAGSGTTSGGGLLGALEAPGLRTLVVYAFAIGVGFGAIEVTMPAFAEGQGARELGALALAAFSAGSMVGGLLAGGLAGGDDRLRLLRYSPLLGLSLLVFQAAWSIPSLCVLAFLAGLPIAPTIAAVYGLIDKVAPSWAVAESFSWFGTSVALGIAIGTALGGSFVDGAGIGWALAVGPLVALVGAAVVIARRDTLRARVAT